MKLKVKLWGMPGFLIAFKGEEEAEVEFNGNNVKDLFYHLFSDLEPEKRGVIFDDDGGISSRITIILNRRIVSDSNRFDRRLRGGDFIELVLAPG